MALVRQGELLWRPDTERLERANLTRYIAWLAQRGRQFDSYAQLWQWSIDDLDAFQTASTPSMRFPIP
jgi:acetoacetyl-CoA synthetase